MKFGSLFTGIGGIDLGLERAGMTAVFQCEMDEFCLKVLRAHWPDARRWRDVRDVDPSKLPTVDLLCGGYPCQPFSLAGVRAGEDDARHLWPEMLRILRVLRPRWVLLENVPGHLSMGFGRVLGDLAEGGYDAEWDCLTAAQLGAPHLRERVFVVAYTVRAGQQGGSGSGEYISEPFSGGGDASDADRPDLRQQSGRRSGARGQGEALAGLDGEASPNRLRDRRKGHAQSHGGPEEPELKAPFGDDSVGHRVGRVDAPDGIRWRGAGPWSTESPLLAVADGLPAGLVRSRDARRWRRDTLKAAGNAVVPQLAEWIGRRIMEADAR